jgi:predicted Zn-dependent protease
MKKLLATLVVVAAVFVVVPAARADTRTHKAAHVTFWIPDGWSVHEEDALITASDPKDEVGLLFLLRGHKDMKAALAGLDDAIAQIATEVKAGTPQKIELNGMEGVVVDGTGKAEGRPVDLSVVILKTPGDKFLIVLGAIDSRHKRAHDGELKKIVASMKPVRH